MNLFNNCFLQLGEYETGDKYSPFLYDAVMLYAIAINETVGKGISTRSGKNIAASFRGKQFQGKSSET